MSTLRPSTILLLAASLSIFVAGCGFHLRGEADLPAAYHDMRIQAPAVMRDALAVYLHGEGSEGGPVLEVSGEKFDKRVLSVDPDTGRVREVELSYSSTYQVRDTQGALSVEPSVVRLTRDYIYDETSVFGSSREEDVLRQEIRRDAAEQIVRRLQASLRN